MYIPNSLWTWSFAIVTLIQSIITLALERYCDLAPNPHPLMPH